MLQRLLVEAEELLSTGGPESRTAIDMIGRAFALFRAKDNPKRDSTTEVSDRESATRLGKLTRLIAEVDESLASGEPTAARPSLEKIREALDIARRLDEPAHTSGIRLRLGA